MNEEVGEISLSVLTRKLKVPHLSNQLDRVTKAFVTIPKLKEMEKDYTNSTKANSLQGL